MHIAELKQLLGKVGPKSRIYAVVPTGGTTRKLPLLRVDHHGVPAGSSHPTFPVEVFVPAWHQPDVAGVSMTAEKLIAELGRFDDDRSVRVTVPTDQGFHRCLDIRALAFGEGDAMTLECEAWEGAYGIVRADLPPDSGV